MPVQNPPSPVDVALVSRAMLGRDVLAAERGDRNLAYSSFYAIALRERLGRLASVGRAVRKYRRVDC